MGITAKSVKETVYGEPGSPGAGYNPNSYNTSFAKTNPLPDQKRARVFLIIAAVTALNLAVYHWAFYAGEQTSMVLTTLAVILVFGLLWVFAKRGSSAAYLIGMLLYGADTVLLLQNDFVRNGITIVTHVILLAYMFRGYRANRS